MSDMPFLTPHFWLLLVLYPGVAGALYFHIKLKKHVAAGSIEAGELRRFEFGWVLAISIPCIALWLLGHVWARAIARSLRLESPPKMACPSCCCHLLGAVARLGLARRWSGVALALPVHGFSSLAKRTEPSLGPHRGYHPGCGWRVLSFSAYSCVHA